MVRLSWGCTFPCLPARCRGVLAGMSAKPSPLPVSSVPGGPDISSLAAVRASSLASPSQDRALTRRLVVGRLLVLDEAGSLETAHVRIAAATAGVSLRTIWRWPAAARQPEPPEPASGRVAFTLTDQLWSRLSDLGGNVKALHRWMHDQPPRLRPAERLGGYRR